MRFRCGFGWLWLCAAMWLLVGHGAVWAQTAQSVIATQSSGDAATLPPPPPRQTTGVTGVAAGVNKLQKITTVTAPDAATKAHGDPVYSLSQPKECPIGYAKSPLSPTAAGEGAICQVSYSGVSPCAALPGYYACGRNGAECCPADTENRCFPGSYACSDKNSADALARTSCCLQR